MSSEQIPVTISTQTSTTVVPPEGPHGVPPSEGGPAVVAQEDKTITTRVVEAVQPYIQPVITPVVNAASAVGATASNVAGAASDAIAGRSSQIAEQVAELRDEAQKQAGLGVNTSGGRPEAPHGVAPTNYNHGGIVAQQDKTVVQVAGEKVVAVKDQVVAAVGAAVEEVKHQAGYGVVVTPGTQPEAPHGIAPSNYNHTGVVAQQDKTVIQVTTEKVAAVIDSAAATINAAVDTVKQQAGYGVAITPGTQPEAPHGIAPSTGLPSGIVAQQDKTVLQVAGEKVVAVKDQVVAAASGAAGSVSAVVGEAKHQAGLGVYVAPGQKPEAPHGVAPSAAIPSGIVSSQDKTTVQVAQEKVAAAVDVAAAKVGATVEEVKHQAGLGVAVTPGQKPEAPHGIAPSDAIHSGIVAQEDKTTLQVAAEKAAALKDQAVAAASNAAGNVSAVVGEAKHQAGLGVYVAPGQKPEAPHGVAPSAAIPSGIVSSQDKTTVQVAQEKVAGAVDQAASTINSAVGEAKHQAGLGVNIQAGQKPEAPHGIAPSDAIHSGIVAQEDKTTLQVANEKLAATKDQVVDNVNAASAAVAATANNAAGAVGL